MKKVLLAFLIAVFALSVIACGDITVSDTSAPGTTNPPKPTTPITVVTTAPGSTDGPIAQTKYHLSGLLKDDFTVDGLVFDVYENGAALVGYNGEGTEVTVPAEVEGKKVTLVDDAAFSFCKNVTKITLPEGVIRVGKDAFYSCKALAEIVLPASLTAIGDEAFSFCESLKTLNVPSSATELGKKLFYSCSSLEEITLNISDVPDEMFYHCSSLKSYVIPDGAKSIGNKAFCYCESLTSVTIPASVETIGEYAFANCVSLADVDLPASVTEIAPYAFYGCSLINGISLDNVTVIGKLAFYGCASLDNVNISENIVSLDNGCFAGCTSLKNVKLPVSVRKIPAFMFRDCTALESVEFSPYLTEIGSRAFLGTGIKTVNIPATVRTIGGYAFENCASLTTVTFGKSYLDRVIYVATADKEQVKAALAAFESEFASVSDLKENVVDENGDPVLGEDGNQLVLAYSKYVYRTDDATFDAIKAAVLAADVAFVKDAETVEQPAALATIGTRIFASCASLEHMALPESVKELGEAVFYGCENLKSVSFGSNITKIGKEAFYNCPSFGKTDDGYLLELPDSITNIGSYALGYRDVTIVNEETGKEATMKTAFDGFKIVGFTNGGAHKYATDYKLSFASLGITGCIPFAELQWEEVTDSVTGSVSYKITGYTGTSSVISLPSNKDGVYFTAIKDGLFENRTDITEIKIPGSFTYIGERAFAGCTNATVLELPVNSGKVVFGKSAFEGVSATSVVLPEGLDEIPEKLFYGADKLEKITLPAVITSIGDYAFAGTKLAGDVVISDSAVSVGKSAFEGTQITSLTVPFVGGSATENGVLGYIFGGEVPETLKTVTVTDVCESLSDGAFKDCEYLESITIGKGIKKLGDYVFAGCVSLKGNIVYNSTCPETPSGVAHLMEGAPEYIYLKVTNTNVKTFDLKQDDKGYTVWQGCRVSNNDTAAYFKGKVDGMDVTINYGGTLTIKDAVAIPDYTKANLPLWLENAGVIRGVKLTNVTSVGNYAFYGCENLVSIEIPATVTAIGEYAFYGAPATDKLSILCKGSIGAHAFDGIKIKTLELSADITSIAAGAFANAEIEEIKLASLSGSNSTASFASIFGGTVPSTLKSIIILDTATEIPAEAFKGIKTLESVTVGKGVTKIGAKAFEGCTALEKVTFLGTEEDIEIAEDAFASTPYSEKLNEENKEPEA